MSHAAKIASTIFVLLVVVGLAPMASASQQPGHIYLSLVALESAPQEVATLLAANPGHYTAGATGPDIALLAYPVREKFGWHHPGSLPHYQRTGRLIINMLRRAGTDEQRAFALGWMTHYWVDNTIHPLVNNYGGFYTGPGARPGAKERHVELELFEAKHVLHTVAARSSSRPGTLAFYRTRASQVQTSLIAQAMSDTYVDGWLSWNRFRFLTPPLVLALGTGAALMQQATAWFVNQEQDTSGLIDPVIRALLGPIPTTEEYRQLMEPLRISGVVVVPADRPQLRVDYRVNDVRLLRAFADDWEPAAQLAVNRILNSFRAYEADPDRLGRLILDDLNLDTGLSEQRAYDPEAAFPGNPAITQLLVTCVATDPAGNDVAVWPSPGRWVPLTELTEQVWGGPAGSGSFDIPLPAGPGGQWEVDLTIEFARHSDQKPYGVSTRWQGTLTVGQERTPEQDEKPPAPEQTPEPPQHVLTAATSGKFGLTAGFYGTIEQRGIGDREPSWGPRDLEPTALFGYGMMVNSTDSTGLEWSGREFQASQIHEFNGQTYESWVRGAVSASGDRVEWVECGRTRQKPADAGDAWVPYEHAWRAEQIPLQLDENRSRTMWHAYLSKEEALDRLAWFRLNGEERNRGSYGGYQVLVTVIDWPGSTDPKMGHLEVEFVLRN